MFIKNIKLQNYRNYESLDLDLGKQTTVLIGKNGMGKTNMITALKQSLSFIFTKSSQVCQRNFIANTIQKVKSFDTTDARRNFDENGLQCGEGTFPIKIETSIDIDENDSLHVVYQRDNISSGMREFFTSESIKYWNHYNNLTDLPVLAFFSDSFPHEKTTIGKKIQDLLNSEYGISQSAGYYNWDDPRDCGLVWQQYYAMQWKNHKYGHSKNNEAEYIEAIDKCMKSFSESLPDSVENNDFALNEITLVSRGKEEVVVLRFANGIESEFENLPAGYRRVFSIAFDLANRAFLLNKNCNPSGICFVDEIDLHLHPSLAQEILERLRRTFVRVQFIVSTHSPVVLSNFMQDDDNIVYQLGRNEVRNTVYRRLPNPYGIDYNSLLISEMETPVRNSLLQELRDAYNYWKRENNRERMEKVMNKIIRRVGEDSVMVKSLREGR